ncbi:UNVERIFIED_ORG: helix-turn-helix protein [Gordonia westfalica J30]
MPNIDEEAKAWQTERSGVVGAAINRRRRDAGLTALELAKRTRELGYPISRVAISKIESNSRAGKLDVAEVSVIAAALGVPPVELLYPNLPDGEADVLPLVTTRSIVAAQWLAGEVMILPDGEVRYPYVTDTLTARSRNLVDRLQQLQRANLQKAAAASRDDEPGIDEAHRSIMFLTGEIAYQAAELIKDGYQVDVSRLPAPVRERIERLTEG